MFKRIWLQVQTLISQLLNWCKNYSFHQKVRKANDSGLLGEIVNVAGTLRRTAVIEIFENKQDLRLKASLLGHKKTY
jgi:hypothetical protein